MKNLIKSVLLFAFILFGQPSTATPLPVSPQVKGTNQVEATGLSRLEEIKALDKSGMSKSEKKALREEARDIKRGSGGVYLSVGAVIIIILVLIILV